MSRLLRNEKGYATVIVIVMIVVMALLLGGLLPLVTTVTQSAGYTRGNLQAQYIAEAGAKRAIAELSSATDSTSWFWLYHQSWQKVTVNSGVKSRYQVNIDTPDKNELQGIPKAGTYTVTSTGQYGIFSKTVRVKVGKNDFTRIPQSDWAIGGNVITDEPGGATIQSNGNALIKGSNINVKFDGGINNNNRLQTGAAVKQDEVHLTNVPFMIPSGSTNIMDAKIDGQRLKLEDAKTTIYSYNGPNGLVFRKNGKFNGIMGTTASGEYSVVIVNGDLTFDSSLETFNQDGKVVFLINGNLHVNTSMVSLAGCCFYCDTAYFEYPPGTHTNQNLSMKLITRKNLEVKTSYLGNINNTDQIFIPAAFGNYLDSVLDGISVFDWSKGN